MVILLILRSLERSKREQTPTLHELDLLNGTDHGQIRIIDDVSANWKQLAIRLYFKGNDIDRIRRGQHHQPVDCCLAVFTEWLNGKGRQPKTWNTVQCYC